MMDGVRQVKKDNRDYSAHRTFGATPPVFPDSYSCELGLGFPDQNAEGFPEACTGYTQSELCQDEDGVPYFPRFTYDKTLLMEGQKEGQPCDIRDSLKSTILYGVQPLPTPPNADAVALTHQRAAYFVIEQNYGLDWSDSIKNMLWAARPYKGSVSMASPWFPEWTGSNIPSSGIVSAPANWTWLIGHNWKISGWKTINGVPYLCAKTWQGSNIGDHGWIYFSREIINKLMTVSGTGAFMLLRADQHNPADIQLIHLSLFDWLGSFFRNLMGIK